MIDRARAGVASMQRNRTEVLRPMSVDMYTHYILKSNSFETHLNQNIAEPNIITSGYI